MVHQRLVRCADKAGSEFTPTEGIRTLLRVVNYPIISSGGSNESIDLRAAEWAGRAYTYA